MSKRSGGILHAGYEAAAALAVPYSMSISFLS